MSDKALLTRGELELTQKIQREFPVGGVIHPNIIKELNDCPQDDFGKRLAVWLQNRGQLQIISTTGIVPPKGGVILPLTVPVNEAREWREAIRAGCPETPSNCDILKVCDQYPPLAGAMVRLEQIWLANFGKGSATPSDQALSWGKKQKLIPVSPRACFAVAEHFPAFHTCLGMNPLAVVSLRTCNFGGGSRVCYSWFGGSERRAYLYWFGYDCSDYCWFAFARE